MADEADWFPVNCHGVDCGDAQVWQRAPMQDKRSFGRADESAALARTPRHRDREQGALFGGEVSLHSPIARALLDHRDVASLAAAMQQRIEEACDTMLGTPGTTARVRFLPSKTTVQTVEVSGE